MDEIKIGECEIARSDGAPDCGLCCNYCTEGDCLDRCDDKNENCGHYIVEEKKTIYIAGKITGCEDYVQLFDDAHGKLHIKGHIVLNPCILPDNLKSHKDYMTICKAMIEVADAVYFLENWTDSKGAKEEYEFATEKGKEILNVGVADKNKVDEELAIKMIVNGGDITERANYYVQTAINRLRELRSDLVDN